MSLKSVATATDNGKRKRILLSDFKLSLRKMASQSENEFFHTENVSKKKKGEKERRNSVNGKISWLLLSNKEVLPIPVRKQKQHPQKKQK